MRIHNSTLRALIIVGAAILPTAFAKAQETPVTPGTSLPSPQASSTPPQTPPTQQPQQEPTPQDEKRRFQLGLGISKSRFINARSRDRFGSGGLSLRPTFFPLQAARVAIRPEVELTYAKRNNNRVLMALLGASYRHALSNNGATNLPTQFYFKTALGIVPASIRSNQDNVHSGVKLGVGGSLALGYLIQRRVDLEVRYMAISRIQSFNLSAVEVGADIKF